MLIFVLKFSSAPTSNLHIRRSRLAYTSLKIRELGRYYYVQLYVTMVVRRDLHLLFHPYIYASSDTVLPLVLESHTD